MSATTYPPGCLSFYCGRICCDGCDRRPILAAWYRETGRDFEASQAEAREILARVRRDLEARIAREARQ